MKNKTCYSCVHRFDYECFESPPCVVYVDREFLSKYPEVFHVRRNIEKSACSKYEERNKNTLYGDEKMPSMWTDNDGNIDESRFLKRKK